MTVRGENFDVVARPQMVVTWEGVDRMAVSFVLVIET